MLEAYPDRVHVLNTRAMFSDPSELARLFAWLNLGHETLAGCKTFGRKVNGNRSAIPLTPVQHSILNSNQLGAFCFDSLSSGLIEMSGFSC
jgi:hypothetical protein